MTFQRELIRAGAWSSLAGSGPAEILSRSGAAWVVLDAQHGTYDDAAIRRTLAELGTLPVPVFVRVLDDSAALIGRALDAGASGIIVPMVDSPEQARRAADACRYPPHGQRSWGPATALVGRPTPDASTADGVVLCAVMVETAAAVACVDEIAATAGVDMVFVGPFDLALALGRDIDELLGDQTADSPLALVVAACARSGIRSGAFAGAPGRADRLAQLGFTDLAVMTDAALLASAAQSEMSRWTAQVATRPGAY